MRSAESEMGVSGFLISCAMRRATSCQAAAFCARSRSLVSSSTSTNPRCSSSEATVTAKCRTERRALYIELTRGGTRPAGPLQQIANFGQIFAREQILQAFSGRR